nr:hypothetical protein [Oscillospiraceae bacterium]
MNGNDIFKGLQYIDTDLIQEAEFGSFPRMRTLRRPLQIAAVIALALLLVGCAVVYVLNMQGLLLGHRQTEYDSFSADGLEYLGKETVTEQVLTLAGLQGTPAYQAAQEWFDFQQSYDPDHEIQKKVWGSYPEFPEEYSGYNLYTQEMKEALDTIAAKYGLKLRGKRIPFQTTKLTMRALGMENILVPGSEAAMEVTDAWYYENGNLNLGFDIVLPDGKSTWGYLYYRRKDCLIDDTCIISGDSWQEWNHTTPSGHDTLILRSPETWVAWIFCDMGESTASLRVEARADVYSELPDGTDIVESTYMTDRQLEQLADCIDFSIQPKLTEGYETMPDGAVGSGETINGYSIRLKSVETDGYAATITLGITAPEGTVLIDPEIDDYNVVPGNWARGFFTPVTEVDTIGASSSGGSQEDGDGLANTVDFVLETKCTTRDGSMPFGPDAVWRIYFEDIHSSWWDDVNFKQVEPLIAEGTWDMEISFADGDFRELELLAEPITATACTGWKLDGTDVLEERTVTSVKLRSHSIDLTCDDTSADFFCFTGKFSYVIMKDGSQTEFTSGTFRQPIDLDQVACIVLADGTKLPVPGVDAETIEAPTLPGLDESGLELLSQPMEYHSLAGYATGPDGVDEPLYEVFTLTSITLSPSGLTIRGTWAFDGPEVQMQVVMEDGSQVTLTGSCGAPYAEPASVLTAEREIDLSQAVSVLFPDGTKVDIPH